MTMRRITVTSDLFVMLGILAVIMGHFRYTRRVVQVAKAPVVREPRSTGAGLSIPAAATAAVVAGTALLRNAARRSTAAYTSKPL
jgi:nitrate reductase gamma subunit